MPGSSHEPLPTSKATAALEDGYRLQHRYRVTCSTLPGGTLNPGRKSCLGPRAHRELGWGSTSGQQTGAGDAQHHGAFLGWMLQLTALPPAALCPKGLNHTVGLCKLRVRQSRRRTPTALPRLQHPALTQVMVQGRGRISHSSSVQPWDSERLHHDKPLARPRQRWAQRLSRQSQRTHPAPASPAEDNFRPKQQDKAHS